MRYHIKSKGKIGTTIIEEIYSSVFRKDCSQSGYSIITFEASMSSEDLRQQMVSIKEALTTQYQKEFYESLAYYWLGRFSQQTTTKFHRDNAPENSFLMLGYEPSEIESRLYIADYHKLVSDRRISIDEYYDLHNPIFTDGGKLLKPYIKEVPFSDSQTYKIVLINNSDLSSTKTLGILHKAEIINKNLTKLRVVNSLMLYSKPLHLPSLKSEKDESDFLKTQHIHI